MVFLFNDMVFELGDLRSSLAASGCPISEATALRMTNSELLGLVKEAFFAAPSFHRENPEKAKALAALVAMKTGANALLCLRGPNTASAEEMQLRLGEISLEVAGDLVRRQKQGDLTPRAIDAAVWAA